MNFYILFKKFLGSHKLNSRELQNHVLRGLQSEHNYSDYLNYPEKRRKLEI